MFHCTNERKQSKPSRVSITKVWEYYILDTLRDLVPFALYKKCEKNSWRSVSLSKVAKVVLAKAWNFNKGNTPSWVFFTFFKLYKWSQIDQGITICALRPVLNNLPAMDQY